MGIKALHHLYCQIWKQQEWPEDWKLQEFVMLYKNDNSKECGNYRTIALISHASEILLIIILNRMKCKVEEELSDCQAGYRANRGTTDMLFVLQIIIEKIRDGNEEGYITFIDYSKAFDSVIHSKLLDIMTEMGFPQHLISMIDSLYHNQKATIRWNNANCEPFNIEKGVRQGCLLSPHLFNLYTEQIMRQADIDDMGINIGGRDITNLRYADDTALLSDNLTSMKRILHRVNNAGQPRQRRQLTSQRTGINE
ncbi:retrovirus-related Pol polyprotein from type-2 retrotransposable element R2DM [Elysia marginata]|uniref:Retrovirus-related Pol polyprotein from type-2 retrotransposable element R2DM n=1 Tax=Elysia marginata TaxID=1093978 RepID=A0AAV4HYR7_9GAST|nr:retrovirus-related Pol polyprotein from type-2 retrotransposable element R2DM [Elysia marginata]